MGDIVITATREKQSDGSWGITLTQGVGIPGVRFVTPRQVDPNGSEPEPQLQVSVKVECSTPETCQKVQAAAAQLASAVLKTLTACENTNPITQVTVAGKTSSVAAYQDTIMATKYVVTDVSTFGNNGGGTADSTTMTDTIYFGTILGTPPQDVPGGVLPGQPGWNSWVNGVVSIVLHEASHMTPEGAAFFNHSVEIAGRDPTVLGSFYSSDPKANDYAKNNEAFAFEFEKQMGIVLGYDPATFAQFSYSPPVTPETIYQNHTGQAYSS